MKNKVFALILLFLNLIFLSGSDAQASLCNSFLNNFFSPEVQIAHELLDDSEEMVLSADYQLTFDKKAPATFEEFKQDIKHLHEILKENGLPLVDEDNGKTRSAMFAGTTARFNIHFQTSKKEVAALAKKLATMGPYSPTKIDFVRFVNLQRKLELIFPLPLLDDTLSGKTDDQLLATIEKTIGSGRATQSYDGSAYKSSLHWLAKMKDYNVVIVETLMFASHLARLQPWLEANNLEIFVHENGLFLPRLTDDSENQSQMAELSQIVEVTVRGSFQKVAQLLISLQPQYENPLISLSLMRDTYLCIEGYLNAIQLQNAYPDLKIGMHTIGFFYLFSQDLINRWLKSAKSKSTNKLETVELVAMRELGNVSKHSEENGVQYLDTDTNEWVSALPSFSERLRRAGIDAKVVKEKIIYSNRGTMPPTFSKIPVYRVKADLQTIMDISEKFLWHGGIKEIDIPRFGHLISPELASSCAFMGCFFPVAISFTVIDGIRQLFKHKKD